MKRFAALLLGLVLLCTGGCGSQQQAAPPIIGQAQVAVRQKELLDLGKVRLFVGTSDSDDEAKEQRLLGLIQKSIEQQRNVRMELEIRRVDYDHISSTLDTMMASNNPPEIWTNSDLAYYEENPVRYAPLRLNESIEQYGPNLKKIANTLWKNCSIGGTVLGIPRPFGADTCLAIKMDVLEQYGWEVPRTADELEGLLQAAKSAGIAPFERLPIVMYSWFGLDYLPEMLYKNSNGKLVPASQTKQYSACLSKLLEWRDKGYYATQEPLRMWNTPPDIHNGLIFMSTLSELATAEGAEMLPPIPLGDEQPSYPSLYWKCGAFEAYNKPAGLVTLIDWLIASQNNYNLATLGQPDVDYRMDGDDSYVLVGAESDTPSAGWQGYFKMPSLFPLPMQGCVNRSGYENAVQWYDNPSRDNRNCLPANTALYARPGTRLWKAWAGLLGCSFLTPLTGYIGKRISYEEFIEQLKEIEQRMQLYTALTQEYIDGKYDPLQDMIVPAN